MRSPTKCLPPELLLVTQASKFEASANVMDTRCLQVPRYPHVFFCGLGPQKPARVFSLSPGSRKMQMLWKPKRQPLDYSRGSFV